MTKKIFIYIVGILSLLIIFWFWGINSGPDLWADPASQLIAWGRLAGLLAAYFVLLQLMFIGRQKWLERSFGLDRLAEVHHLNGILSIAFIIVHPVLLCLGYGALSGRNAFAQLGRFLSNWEGMVAALVATVLFAVIVAISLAAAKKHFKYEIWYAVHLLSYLAIILAFSHQLETGSDLRNIFFAAYWNLLYILVGVSLIYSRFLRPLYYLWRYRFRVEKVVAENDDNVSIYISGRQIENFPVRPGQFFLVRFLTKKYLFEAHPFSLSSLPGEKYLRFTVKALGDFTTGLQEKIKPGDLVFLDGPHGLFTPNCCLSSKVAYIAGGVGVTPIRSVAEYFLTEKDAILLYANQRPQDIIFAAELADLISRPGSRLRLVSILAEGAIAPAESGRVDEEKILRLIPDYLERDFYLCGPPAMRLSLVKTLRSLGVKARAIHFEKFSWH